MRGRKFNIIGFLKRESKSWRVLVLAPASIGHLIGRVRKSILQQGAIRCKKDNKSRELVWGFTLLELLIVIAVIVAITMAAILVLNPIEYSRQSKDSKRISEVADLDKAVSLFNLSGTEIGTSGIVYISLPDDSSAICADLNLPSLGAGYEYRCVTGADLRRVDGAGWMPVDFTQGTGINTSPLSALPVDSANDPDLLFYYAYVTDGGKWVLASPVESGKYIEQTAAADGGTDPIRYERGSDILLWAKAQGLVRYWTFDEGIGFIAADSSGNGGDGEWGWDTTAPYWFAPGKVGGYAGQASSPDGAIRFSSSEFLPDTKITASFWFRYDAGASFPNVNVFSNSQSPVSGRWILGTDASGNPAFTIRDSFGGSHLAAGCGGELTSGVWHFMAGTYNGNVIRVYLNGDQCGNAALSGQELNTAMPLGISNSSAISDFAIDDVRVYNRPLSDLEIKYLYDAQK